MAMRSLGPYVLERRLAIGGSSEIFLAHLAEGETSPGLTPGETVVVKRPLPHVLEDPALTVSFLQECQLAMAVDHPGLVRGLHAATPEEGGPYLVMEYIRGRSLLELLRVLERQAVVAQTAYWEEHKDDPEYEGSELVVPLGFTALPAPYDVIAAIACQLGAALAWLHGMDPPFPRAAPLLHRDVHPRNILIEDSGRVVLVDLGLVATAGEPLPPGADGWVSPEVRRGEPPAISSDLYSVGRVMWDLEHGFHHPGELDGFHVSFFELPALRNILVTSDDPGARAFAAGKGIDDWEPGQYLTAWIARCLGFDPPGCADDLTTTMRGECLRELSDDGLLEVVSQWAQGVPTQVSEEEAVDAVIAAHPDDAAGP
ncbi:MAG: protein kinase [Myxococcota bacterium]|nr:protein kinase [Myxococcota bacterium]